MDKHLHDLFIKTINTDKKKDLTQYSALNLAYIGDAVFEILVRTFVLMKAKTSVNNLHLLSKDIVKAESQSNMYNILTEHLSEEEAKIIKRGRNAKSHSKAKNASILDYRQATGLEALFGYLYLKGDINRILELFEICINIKEQST
ncbi:MAG: ribonuclease III [Defluviitaleaceae bacterium]|nr:ribonuclease III [Defluviitaleaceae bacterium]